jgi:succinoglycan biosynthesis transport protein ExoP
VTLRDMRQALSRFFPLALLVFMLALGVGAAASYLPTERYRASTVLFVEPSDPRSLEFGARESLTFVIPSIVRQVETGSFRASVRQRLGLQGSDEKADLSAKEEPGTGVLTLSAESPDPRAAASFANTGARLLSERRISNSIRIRVLDPARPPSSAATPRKLPIMLSAAVLGLIAAVFAALAASSLRRRLAGAEMIRKRFGLTVLGEIPASSRGFDSNPAELFHRGEPRDVVEEYHRLRTNVDILVEDRSTIAITSWAQSEGKTTVTANLGWALASLGRDVTVVDCDLRRPHLHTRFGVELGQGVSDVAGKNSAQELSHTLLPTLRLLTAGHAQQHPANILSTALPQVEESYPKGLILVDTPPLFTADTTMIASVVDAMIIVIDVRRRSPAELESVLEELRLTQTKILGVVLNRARSNRRRRAAGYYYSTSQREQEEAPAPQLASVPAAPPPTTEAPTRTP